MKELNLKEIHNYNNKIVSEICDVQDLCFNTSNKIVPFAERPINGTKEYLLNELRNYPVSAFKNTKGSRVEYNTSLYGFICDILGEESTLEITHIEPVLKYKEIVVNGSLIEDCYWVNERQYAPINPNTPQVEYFISNKESVLLGRELLAKGDVSGKDKQKKLTYAISGSAVYPLNAPNRKGTSVQAYNNILIIDVDLKITDDLESVRKQLEADQFTKIVGSSYSGDGFFVVVEMSEEDANTNEKFKAIFAKLQDYYLETYNIMIDKSCSDRTRLRIATYDPKVFIKENLLVSLSKDEIDAIKWGKLTAKLAKPNAYDLIQNKQSNNYKKTVTELTFELIARGLQDINGYKLWLSIAWSLHDHSFEWSLINDDRHKEPYHSTLKTANITGAESITIATFYKFCQDHGISLYHPKPKKEIKTIVAVESDENIITEIKDQINKYERVDGEVLEDNQFLSEKLPHLIDFWKFNYINILASPASSGKTSMVTKLREKGKRVLLIVPTIAIIKNKKLKNFVQVYGKTNIRDFVGTNDSIITTFDKASRLSVTEFNQFDFVIVDEFHLLFTENYRIRAISPLVNIIKSAVLRNRNNTLINTTKFVLMSGTPLGEEYLNTNVDEQLTCKKTYINHKKRNANFVVCDDYNASYTCLINNAVKFITDGYRVFIPSDAGEK